VDLKKEYVMKIRLKFIKQGQVKFVGHLDIMRLFQRAIKVAQIPIAYSQGFNPHSLVYFAMPLSVGVSSTGEYMDMVTAIDVVPEQIKGQLNKVLVEGIEMIDAFCIEEDTGSLMSLVSAASYEIGLPKNEFTYTSPAAITDKLKEQSLVVHKKGKKGIQVVDVKPMILECNIEENVDDFVINVKAHAGSSQNLSPQLFLKAVLNEEDGADKWVNITRRELYAYDDGVYIPLDHYRRIV
jgi:radical SAM-linked protein